MEFTGSQTIAATREQVWNGLNDAAVLQACVPGCEEFVAQNDDEYKAVVVASVGPVKARFKGTLLLSDRDGPNGYKILGQGEGGIAGFGKMTATVTLADADEGGTLLTYVPTRRWAASSRRSARASSRRSRTSSRRSSSSASTRR